LGDPAAGIAAHPGLGVVHALAGRHDDAQDHLVRALAPAERAGDRTARLHTHRGLSNAWSLRGDDRRAVEHARRSPALLYDVGDVYPAVKALDCLGDPCLALGQRDEANVVWQEALALYRVQRRDERVRQRLPANGGLAPRPSSVDGIGVVRRKGFSRTC